MVRLTVTHDELEAGSGGERHQTRLAGRPLQPEIFLETAAALTFSPSQKRPNPLRCQSGSLPAGE